MTVDGNADWPWCDDPYESFAALVTRCYYGAYTLLDDDKEAAGNRLVGYRGSSLSPIDEKVFGVSRFYTRNGGSLVLHLSPPGTLRTGLRHPIPKKFWSPDLTVNSVHQRRKRASKSSSP
ncbi:hypothetical protein Bca4012_027372 [Brassica carinata]